MLVCIFSINNFNQTTSILRKIIETGNSENSVIMNKTHFPKMSQKYVNFDSSEKDVSKVFDIKSQ